MLPQLILLGQKAVFGSLYSETVGMLAHTVSGHGKCK